MAINSKLQQMLADAEKRGYAVPSFNYSCIWDFQAILEAAEEERSPVILASHHSVFDMLSGEICAGIGKLQWIKQPYQWYSTLTTQPKLTGVRKPLI